MSYARSIWKNGPNRYPRRVRLDILALVAFLTLIASAVGGGLFVDGVGASSPSHSEKSALLQAPLAGNDWRMAGYGPADTHFNPEATINVSNAGQLIMKFGSNPGCGGNGVPAVVGGTVYDGGANGLCAIDSGNGGPNWSALYGDQIPGPAVVNGTVYAGDLTRVRFSGFNATTGAKVFTNKAVGGLIGAPRVANGVAYAGGGSWVYAFNAVTGAVKWAYATGGTTVSSPAVANGVVYAGSSDGKLYAIQANGSGALWIYSTGGTMVSSPAVANGVVYVNANDGKLYAFNAATGVPLWAHAINVDGLTTPAVGNGKVFAGSSDGKLYVFNASTGVLLWTFTSGGYVNSPAVGGGVVYASSSDGNLYALDLTGRFGCSGTVPRTCNPLWKSGLHTIRGVPYDPVISHGTVYVTDSFGTIYAFGLRKIQVVERYQAGGKFLVPGATDTSTATCNAGEVAVGGGYVAVRAGTSTADDAVSVGWNEASPDGATNPTQWTVTLTNNDSVNNVTFGARIMCASAGVPLNVTEYYQAGGKSVAFGASSTSTAACFNTQVAVGGGYVAVRAGTSTADDAVSVGWNEASPDGATNPTQWTVTLTNNDSVNNVTFGARILCLS